MSDIMTKISKILKQAEAEGTTPEEAEAFFKAAQQLGTKYNIDLAMARQATQQRERREEPVRRSVEFDAARNTKKHFVELYSTIATHNDLRMDIRRDSTAVYPYGFPSDQDVAEAIFASVSLHMVEEANKYLAKGEYKAETQGRYVKRKRYDGVDSYDWGAKYDYQRGEYYVWDEEYVNKPIDGRTARANFYSSYISQIGRRLREANAAAKAEVVAEREAEAQRLMEAGIITADLADSSAGMELALLEKDEEVRDFYKKTSNARGSWSGPSAGGWSASASSAGSAAAKSARIGAGAGAMGGAKAIGS